MGGPSSRTVVGVALALLVFVVAEPREVGALIANADLWPMVAAVALSLADRFAMAYIPQVGQEGNKDARHQACNEPYPSGDRRCA